jgi:tetratricopeptide (TPR) repeat protein
VVDDALALAWGLKTLCYEAWAGDPPSTARVADGVHALLASGVPAHQVPEVTALSAWCDGISCLTRGRMADAVDLFDTAAALFRAAGHRDPAAQTQVPKIMALSMLGQHEQAAACAEATQRELLGLGNLRAAARVSQNLGGLHLRRDAYADAARHYREAAVLFARLGEHSQSVLADIGLADALAAMGDFAEATRVYARARVRAGRLSLEPQLALIDESVGLLDLVRGHYRAALAGLESARRRYEALQTPQLLAVAEKQLADAYLELRLLPEAAALLTAAVEQFRALALPDEQAWALNQLGRAQTLLGQADVTVFARAQDIFTAQGNQVGMAAVAMARAELALAGGDAQAAQQWAAEASAGFEATRRADGRARADVLHAQALLEGGQLAGARQAFERSLLRAIDSGQLDVQVRCLAGQGRVALAEGDAPGAASAFEASIELFEDQRAALPADDLRSAFLTDHLRPYEELLRMALASGDAVEVLQRLDRFRARALDERLADERHSDDAVGAGDDALHQRMNWLHRRLQRLQDEAAPCAAVEAELRQVELELLERARRRRMSGPASTGSPAAPLDIGTLQRALAPGDALVEYGAIDDELFACVVRRDALVLVRRMARWTDVRDAARSVQFQMAALRHGATPVGAHLPLLAARAQARLAAVQALVWQPLALALQGVERVMLVPHGVLGALPFAALPWQGQTLGHAVELAWAHSARAALRGLQRRPRLARRVVALAEGTGLPHATAEANAVARQFAHGQAFVGAEATSDTVRAQAPAADVLHFACHAQFRRDNPRFSALQLHDGALTVDQVENLALDGCTVVLSACETGLGDLGAGDERVGLVRAFFVAGAARVLASLWPVDDQATAYCMNQFYQALGQGHGPARALGQAQDNTRQHYAHPGHWGAFTLYGGW